MNNFEKNPDQKRTDGQLQNPDRREFIKIATAVALTAALPEELFAETKTEPKKNPEISPEKLKAIKEAVEEALKDDKYTKNSEEFPQKDPTLYRGGKLGVWAENGNNIWGIPTSFTIDDALHADDVITETNTYGGQTDLDSITTDPELQKAYRHFAKELSGAMTLINSTSDGGGMFINGNLRHSPTDRLNTAYNRLIAIGMVSNWSEAEFRQATTIFAEKVDNTNLPAKLQGKNGLLGPVQMKKIEYFLREFKDKVNHEKNYTGDLTIIQRAKEKYPKNKVKQFIYAMNIFHATLYEWVREKPERANTVVARNAMKESTTSFYPLSTRGK